MKRIADYFASARERQHILIRRLSGQSRPWTDDPVYQRWRFCCVRREDDKTTQWFRNNIRQHLSGIQVVQSTVIFWWFNRIETADIIKDLLLAEWNHDEALKRLRSVRPLVTGAYMIKTPTNLDKLHGMLEMINTAIPLIRQLEINKWDSLRSAHEDLRQIPYLGPFMAYEVVSDLRWTSVLKDAIDLMTWANAGPGCAHGLGLVVSGDRRQFNRHQHQEEMLEVMLKILELSKDKDNWPWTDIPWEMREVEHWACEVDKYIRGQNDIGLKRKFDGRPQ